MHLPIINKRPDGMIGESVYIAYERSNNHGITRLYIGTVSGGPILQWDADGDGKWDGARMRNYARGAWTPLYSRGDFGRNYACGGHWSGHTLSLIGQPTPQPIDHGEKIILGGNMVTPPEGIRGDIRPIELPCNHQWAIWYGTADDALRARLSPQQIQASTLPDRTKKHLSAETKNIIDLVQEVINAHQI